MRRAALLAFAAAAVFAGVAGTPLRGARAEDPPVAPPPQDAFAARAPDAARASAAKLWAAAEDARRVQLFEWARREARRVLDLDPDHKGARAFLGFVKKDASWVEDAELAAKWPATNFAGKPPSLEEAATIERRWWRDVHPAARKAAAAVWATLGDDFARKGDTANAQKAYARAVGIDPDQERSRRALGYFRWQGVWLTEAQVRAADAASKAQVVTTESPVEKAFGAPLNKVESAHFRLESRIAPERLVEIARWLETAYVVHLVDVGRDPTTAVFPSLVRMVLCDNESDWTQWIDKFVPRNKEYYRGLEGVWGDNWQYGMKLPADGSDETRRDHLVHRAVHAVDSFVLGVFWPSWVDEGLAHLTTIRVQGMTRTWCLAPSASEYAKISKGGAKTGWVDEKEWRALARAAAAARDDLPLRTLVSQPFPSLGFPGVQKAWSILEYWQANDEASFRTLLPQFRAAKDPAAMIEKHFGKGLEAIDEDWRRYVMRMY